MTKGPSDKEPEGPFTIFSFALIKTKKVAPNVLQKCFTFGAQITDRKSRRE